MAFARYDLRIPEAEFWRMTPREFWAIARRFRAERRHSLYCAVVVASTIINVNRQEGARLVTPEDLMGEKAKRPQWKQSPQDMLAMVMALNEIHGGKDLRKVNG